MEEAGVKEARGGGGGFRRRRRGGDIVDHIAGVGDGESNRHDR